MNGIAPGTSSALLGMQFQVAALKKQQDMMEAVGQAAVSLIEQATATGPLPDGRGQLVNVVA